MIRLKYFITATILATLLSMPVQAQQVIPDQFDEWVQQGMEQWQIPGMAIAVVKDGEVVLAKGYGIQKLGEADLVNEHSQFGIASVSKHMTASSLAVLVDEGVIAWDDPVTKHIPWFKLSDPWATENVTIRDLLTHQVGVGRMLGNRLQFMTNRSREELLYRMRYHDFEQPFRSSYVYSNVMYTLAGEIVKAVTDLTWDEFMHERFFTPMGMSRTNTSITQLHSDENAAWPHQFIRDEVVTIPRRNWDNAAPAGGINSTAADMAEWMKLQLDDAGTHHETEYISSQTIRALQTPQVSLGTNSVDAPQRSYGFGFTITDYNGTRTLTHGGATDGMNTSFLLAPEHNFGIIVMTNVFNSFREAVVYTVLDHMLGIDGNDWNRIYFDGYQNRFEAVSLIREEFESTRKTGTSPTHSLDEYSGSYHHDLYDNADLILKDGKLHITLWDDEELSGELEHWHHNTFRIHWENPGQREDFVKFDMNLEGEINEMTLRFTLRPMVLQVGSYPTNYYRDVVYTKMVEEN